MTDRLWPNIDGLLTTSQRTYADALDLVEACVEARQTGDPDEIRINMLRRMIGDAPGYALAQTVAFLAGLLSAAAVALPEIGDAAGPAEILAEWRQMAASTINRTEEQLLGLQDGGDPR